MPPTPTPEIVPLVAEFQSRLARVPADAPVSVPSATANPAAALPEFERLAGLLRMTGQPEMAALSEGISQFVGGLKMVPAQQVGQLLGATSTP